jgi:hypothetical protein
MYLHSPGKYILWVLNKQCICNLSTKIISFFTKSSVSTSVKNAYVLWVFKDSIHNKFSLLFSPLCQTLYTTTPSPFHPNNLQPVSQVSGPLNPYFPYDPKFMHCCFTVHRIFHQHNMHIQLLVAISLDA